MECCCPIPIQAGMEVVLAFPRPMKIGARNYWYDEAITAWIAAQMEAV